MCDVVINCAGPAKHIVDRVAAAALEQSAHYVDVSGDEPFYRLLLKNQHEIQAKQLTFVSSAGVYPGLSELFPAFAAQTYFDRMELLELFFAGNGCFSFNAAYDIVCSIQDDTGSGMFYCCDGAARRADRPVHSVYTLPSPAGRRDAYPILNYEFLAMAQSNPIRSAWFYNTYPNKAVLQAFITIKALEQYKTEEQKRASARMLVEKFGAAGSGADDYTLFHLVATGSKGGKSQQLVASLVYPGDWNTLSGIVAAQAARLLVQDDQRTSGCFTAAEGVSPIKMIAALSERHIAVTHSITEIELR